MSNSWVLGRIRASCSQARRVIVSFCSTTILCLAALALFLLKTMQEILVTVASGFTDSQQFYFSQLHSIFSIPSILSIRSCLAPDSFDAFSLTSLWHTARFGSSFALHPTFPLCLHNRFMRLSFVHLSSLVSRHAILLCSSSLLLDIFYPQ